MFKIEIETDNAAFDGCEGAEVARILRELAERLDEETFADSETRLRDINGNTVGKVVWS